MNHATEKKAVLFLCTGNSARSQMAEGFLKALAGERFTVYSAGTAPVGLNPWAVQVMSEADIDISGQSSDLLDRELLNQVDLLITLCGDAKETCPVVPARVEKRHWPLEDPARTTGTETEIINSFRDIRDQVKAFVEQLVAE